MRIFISYSFRPRDRWIEELVFPLVTAFEATPVHGKDIQGEKLTDEVKARIERCDALMAFVTRRGDQAIDGKYPSHRWVTDELAFAIGADKAVVEIREGDIDPQDGIGGDRVRINYDETNRVDLVLQLTNTLARWHRQIRRVHVLPFNQKVGDSDLSGIGTEWLRSRVDKPGFFCHYEVLDGDQTSKPVEAKLRFIEGRPYFTAKQLSSGSRLRLQITTPDGVFVSDFENVDDINLPMPLSASGNRLADPRPRALEAALRADVSPSWQK
jgi:hypothetical protein